MGTLTAREWLVSGAPMSKRATNNRFRSPFRPLKKVRTGHNLSLCQSVSSTSALTFPSEASVEKGIGVGGGGNEKVREEEEVKEESELKEEEEVR